MELVGDYGGYNAIENRKAAMARYPAPVAQQQRPMAPRVASNPGGQYARTSRPAAPPSVAPGPVVTDPNAWLGTDTGYQGQLRDLQLALSNFNADVTRRRGDIGTDYGTSQHALNDQKGLDLKSMENDWAGRGLLKSGLYATAVGDYNKEFDQRLAQLLSSRDRALSQLTQEQNSFKTQQELDTQAAREAALRRRSSTLGVVG
jgi:hypothetical protein